MPRREASERQSRSLARTPTTGGGMEPAAAEAECRIVAVGKRRDGGTRYWCLHHKADATAKYGLPAKVCRYGHLPAISSTDIYMLDLGSFPGGVALWGAVPPVYDTTRKPLDR